MSSFIDNGSAFSSQRMDWETPQALFGELDAEFHFTLDAAASDGNAKCADYYTAETDSLKQDWGGATVFCNPPYGRAIKNWVRKCSQEASKPNTTVVMLVPARTDTKWFQNYILHRAEVRFIPGRLHFETNGVPGDAAPFPSMIVVMRTGVRD